MKRILTAYTAGIFLAAFIIFCTGKQATAQTVLIHQLQMNDSLDVWNDGQWAEFEDRKGYKTRAYIYNKCKGHRGTTGKFVIDIRNKGDKHLSAWVMLMPGNIEKYVLEPNNAFHISLAPGEKVSNYTELRGCLPKGRKGMDDQQKCKACKPKLVFYQLNVSN